MRRERLAAAPGSRRELAQIALLKDAHQETIMPLLRDCPVKMLADGEVLLRSGEPCEMVYMVLSGRLRMQNPSSAAPDAIIKAGDSIGELCLLEKTVVGATISAVEPTRLLIVDRDAAWALIRTSHEIARNWLSLFATRSRVGAIIDGSEQLKTSHGPATTIDENTGLHNRHWLESMLPRQISRSNANKEPLGLLLIEIDGFAGYVAKEGQPAGDQACQTAAQALINSVRPTDLVVSYGAAQFAVVLPESDIAGACLAGERTRSALNNALTSITTPPLTVSVGVTQLQSSATASAFLAGGEAALRMAKNSGGNRVGMQ